MRGRNVFTCITCIKGHFQPRFQLIILLIVLMYINVLTGTGNYFIHNLDCLELRAYYCHESPTQIGQKEMWWTIT